MEWWLFIATVSLFAVGIVTSLYFGSRKNGGIKPNLIKYFREAFTFIEFWLFFLVIWLILALTFLTYVYLTADEQGKAEIREMV